MTHILLAQYQLSLLLNGRQDEHSRYKHRIDKTRNPRKKKTRPQQRPKNTTRADSPLEPIPDSHSLSCSPQEQTADERSLPRNPEEPLPDGRSLLEKLPPELRIMVFETLAAEFGAEFSRKKGGTLMSVSKLIGANRQIHEEFSGALRSSASPLTFPVKDFDFSHVVRFLNKLSPRELKRLPKINARSPREVWIFLEVSAFCPPNPEKLQSWLMRFADSKKTGVDVEFRYSAGPCFDKPSGCLLTQEELQLRSAERGVGVYRRLRDQVIPELEPGRVYVETTNVKNGLKYGLYGCHVCGV